MYIAELEHPDFARFDMSSLRKGVMSGAPCPIELMKQRGQADAHGADDDPLRPDRILARSSPCPASTLPSNVASRPSARRWPNTEVQIVDPKTGARLPIGEQGELCTRGYLVMQGYDADPEATAKVIDQDGWLHTGDLAVMHPDGYISFKGRAKDTIIRGGENIYPREVEDFLHTHPKIADVHIIGLPDAKLGETVLAWIQLKTGETADGRRDSATSAAARSRISKFRSTSASWTASP